MIKKGLLISSCLLMAFSVNAKVHQKLDALGSYKIGENENVKVVARSSQQFALTFTRAGVLHVQPFSRGSSGMTPRAELLYVANQVQPDTTHNTITLLGAEADVFGHYQLLKSERCDDVGCQGATYSITVHNASGRLDRSRIDLGYQVIEGLDCEFEPKLYPAPEGVWLDNGCGEVSLYNPLITKTETILALPESLVGQNSNVHHTPYFDWPDANEERIRAVGGLVFISLSEENTVTSYFFDEAGALSETLRFNAEPQTRCFIMPGTEIYVGCNLDSALQVYSLSGESKGVYTPSAGVNELDQGTFSFGLVESGFTWGEYIFLSQPNTLSSVGANEEELVEEQWRVTAYRVADQKQTVVDTFTIESTEAESSSAPEIGTYHISPDTFYAVAQVIEGGVEKLSFYDQLNIDSAPNLIAGLGGTIPSLQSITQSILFEDQETPYDEISFDMGVLKDWFSLDESQTPYQITAEPYHDDVGVETVSLSITDLKGNTFTFDANYTVLLSDYQTLLFEASLFAQLELEDPVPLSSITNAFGGIPLVEDEVYEFVFSWFNRLDEEVSVSWIDLPAWMVWDNERYTLTVYPTQENVGRSVDIKMQIEDSFEPADEEFGEIPARNISFNFNVQEVNEQFSFVGTGEAEVEVGQLYSYTVNIDDEENSVNDMVIDVPVLPEWMSWNRSTRTLSGVPTAENIGLHRVQISVREPNAYLSVQTFSVRVNGTPIEESSGGSMGLWTFLLGLCVVARRRFR